ncbi:hypothetical protein LCGC14_1491720 [marine sediment metagenome]|uniref:Uncharacterized protein n=1 Tax=marine sediment metagenome TaxID=412755 RepID=A0A0F9JSH2_9ZZZZ
MASAIIGDNEVSLGGVRYPVTGSIRRRLISRFPAKVIFGDDAYANEQVLSNFIISDQRGGIGVEEMVEGVHDDRCWISECDLRFRNHMLLPVLATDAGAGGLSAKDVQVFFSYDGATYASFDEFLRIYDNGNTDFNDVIKTLAASPTDAAVVINAAFICLNTSGYDVNPKLWLPDQLVDGDLEVWTTSTNLTNWTEVTVGTGTVTQESGLVEKGSFSARFVTLGATTQAHITQVLSFGKLLRGKEITLTARVRTNQAADAVISVSDAGGTTSANPVGINAFETVTVVHTVGATATNITILVGNVPTETAITYIDDVNISYSETTAPFQNLTSLEPKFVVEWDDKVFGMDAAGKISYTTDLLTWTLNGQLKLPSGSVNSLAIYRDANGTEIIYANAKQGEFAYDFDNAKFLATEVALPNHDNAGKGATRWRDGYFVSAGLDVIKYIAGNPATIDERGLNNDDGLPTEYDGEIQHLIKGYREMFALIDPTDSALSSRMSVGAYDGRAWQLKYTLASADKDALHGIISTDYGEFRLWFGANEKAFSLPLQKSLQNPKKDSNYTYAAAAVHITPWFDAGTAAFAKVAKKVTITAKDTTANETIVVQYRIDHATVDRDTGWTTLGTLTAAADGVETTLEFASGAGLVFDAIQFRFNFVRGGTTTKSPDLQNFVLSYTRKVDSKWGFTFTINTAEAKRVGSNPKKLYDSLIAAIEARLFQEFIYRDGSDATDTRYVLLTPADSIDQSGQGFKGQFLITAVEA